MRLALVLRPDDYGTLLVRLRGRTARAIDKAISFATESAHIITDRTMVLALEKLTEEHTADPCGRPDPHSKKSKPWRAS